MQFFKDNKRSIKIIAVLLCGLWVYFAYFSGGKSSNALLTSDQESSPLSQDVLVTLSNLHVIKLNPNIFSDPVFVSLTDFGVEIPQENIGRRNPFAPL